MCGRARARPSAAGRRPARSPRGEAAREGRAEGEEGSRGAAAGARAGEGRPSDDARIPGMPPGPFPPEGLWPQLPVRRAHVGAQCPRHPKGLFPAAPPHRAFGGAPSWAPFAAALCCSAPRCFPGTSGASAAGRRWGSPGAHSREGGPQSRSRPVGDRQRMCVCAFRGGGSSFLASRKTLASGVWKARGSVNSSCFLRRSEPGATRRRAPRGVREEAPSAAAASQSARGGLCAHPPPPARALNGKIPVCRPNCTVCSTPGSSPGRGAPCRRPRRARTQAPRSLVFPACGSRLLSVDGFISYQYQRAVCIPEPWGNL